MSRNESHWRMIGTVLSTIALTVLAFVTYQHAEEEATDVERMKRSAMASPIATIVADQWGYIVAGNAAFDRLFSFEPGERIGWPISELIGPESQEKHENAFTNAMDRFRKDGKVELKSDFFCRAGQAERKDGTMFWVAVLLSDPVVLSVGRTFIVAAIRTEEEAAMTYEAIRMAKESAR